MSTRFKDMKPDRRRTWFKDLTQDQRETRLKRLRKKNRARKQLEVRGCHAFDNQEVIDYVLWAINKNLANKANYTVSLLDVRRFGDHPCSVYHFELLIEKNETLSEAYRKLLRRRKAIKDLNMAKTLEEVAEAYEFFMINLPLSEDQP